MRVPKLVRPHCLLEAQLPTVEVNTDLATVLVSGGSGQSSSSLGLGPFCHGKGNFIVTGIDIDSGFGFVFSTKKAPCLKTMVCAFGPKETPVSQTLKGSPNSKR